MSLRVVGAGLPRTATKSLQLALEQLLGGRCYHMTEVFERLDQVPVWREAVRGEFPDWNEFLGEYVAAVDWPASAFWRELSEANPDALIVLSVREDAATWWRSADRTILQIARRDEYPEYGEWLSLFHELLTKHIGERWDDPATAMAAYERQNEDVRTNANSGRLLLWDASQGWEPLCEALQLPIPEEPFPHVNTTEEWERGDEEAPQQESAVH